jgi:mono/diheme cytochrome c family protein
MGGDMQKIIGFMILVFLGAMFLENAYAADPGNGGQLYSRHCTTCHGDDGRGAMPGVPDFTRGEGLFQPNSALVNAIRKGKTVMPAIRGILTDDEINDLVAYLRMYR